MQTKARTVFYTIARLKTAIKKDRIAGIAGVGCTVKFMLKNDPDTVGYLVTTDQVIRRFSSDDKAWEMIDDIKAKIEQ